MECSVYERDLGWNVEEVRTGRNENFELRASIPALGANCGDLRSSIHVEARQIATRISGEEQSSRQDRTPSPRLDYKGLC